jgi:hypothetical protein
VTGFQTPVGQELLEQKILEAIAAEYVDDATALTAQLETATRKRDLTGVGSYLNFEVPLHAPKLYPRRPWAAGTFTVSELVHPGGYLLWVSDDGYLDSLECYCVEEWPTKSISRVTIHTDLHQEH